MATIGENRHNAPPLDKPFNWRGLSVSRGADGWVPCPKCGNKTMLCSGLCANVTPDQEPYVSGELENTEYGEDGIDVEIWVSCHYCASCAHLFSASIESPRDDAPNASLEPLARKENQ